MRRIPLLSFLAPLLAAAILAGCGAPGSWDHDRYPNRYPDGAYGRYGDRVVDLQGTVASVNTRDRLIYVDREGTGDRYLRNDDQYNRDSGYNREVAISYDDSTVVSYQGRTFRPADLERGDRIQASVERNGDYLLAQQIDVLYDVSSGGPGYGAYGNDNGAYATDVRGTVRSVDTRNRTLEIDRSGYGRRGFNPDPNSGYGSGDVVLVRYDSSTTVRYQGRDYSPENLERGDVVEVQVRNDDGRMIAQQIDVLGENGRTGR